MKIEIPSLAEIDIKNIAESFVDDIWHAEGDQVPNKLGMSFRLYERHVLPRFGIRVTADELLPPGPNGSRTLGMFDSLAMHARVCASLLNDPRMTFTLFHEALGHGVLHGPRIRLQLTTDSLSSLIITGESAFDERTMSMMEWQANTMARHCAAPMRLVEYHLAQRFWLSQGLSPRALRYKGPGGYDLLGDCTVDSFTSFCRVLARRIQPWFGRLSLQALSLQIKNAQIVENCTDESSAFSATRSPTIGSVGLNLMRRVG